MQHLSEEDLRMIPDTDTDSYDKKKEMINYGYEHDSTEKISESDKSSTAMWNFGWKKNIKLFYW